VTDERMTKYTREEALEMTFDEFDSGESLKLRNVSFPLPHRGDDDEMEPSLSPSPPPSPSPSWTLPLSPPLYCLHHSLVGQDHQVQIIVVEGAEDAVKRQEAEEAEEEEEAGGEEVGEVEATGEAGKEMK